MYRRIISMILIFCMSLHCVAKLGVMAYFYTNHSYIQNELCINKEKPMMHCEGRCFLVAKLKSTENPVRHLPSFLKTAKDSLFVINEKDYRQSIPSLERGGNEFTLYLMKNYKSPEAEIKQPPKLI